MYPTTAFLTWLIAILLWVYLCPVLIVGTLVCLPYFLVVTPIMLGVSLLTVYLWHDTIIPTGALRDLVNTMPYTAWFGAIDTVPVPSRPHLITSHPHGFLCTGILFSTHFRPGSRTVFAVSPWIFAIPVVGWVAHHLGCIPANEGSIRRALKSHSVILVPGGVPELVAQAHYTRRHGFLRIAQAANVSILPVVTRSVHFVGVAAPWLSTRQWVAKTYGVPLMIPMLGWYGTWLPRRVPIRLDIKPVFSVRSDDIEAERKRYYASLGV